MRRAHTLRFAAWLLGLVPAAACGSDGTAGVDPPTGTVPVGLQEVASGLSFPLYLTAPPGDLARLFIVEKAGAIRIVKDGVLLPAPFLDLAGRVSTGAEQGLLGLAFDPAYADNGRFVVHYTDVRRHDDGLGLPRVRRRRRTGRTRASETVLLTVEQPFANHNGGQIAVRAGRDAVHRPGRRRQRRRPGREGAVADRPPRGHSESGRPERHGLHSPARQSVRRPGRRPTRDLELRPPQSLALQLRCGHGRSLHRRRRTERNGRRSTS